MGCNETLTTHVMCLAGPLLRASSACFPPGQQTCRAVINDYCDHDEGCLGRLGLGLVHGCVDLLIQRKRKGKKGKVEAKVKVESAVVDMATGKAPANAVGEAETKVIQMLLGFFGILLTEGLVLAGSVSVAADWRRCYIVGHGAGSEVVQGSFTRQDNCFSNAQDFASFGVF